MPLIKLKSNDHKIAKLISANNLKTILEKGEEKLGYKIGKLISESDDKELIDDKDLFRLFDQSKEPTLIAFCVSKPQMYGLYVSLISGYFKFFEVDNLDSLKKKCEKEFAIILEKFVRKKDMVEITDDNMLKESVEFGEKCLIALERKDIHYEYIHREKPISQNSESNKRGILMNGNEKNVNIKVESKPELTDDDESEEESNYFLKEYKQVEEQLRKLKEEIAPKPINKNQSDKINQIMTNKLQDKTKDLPKNHEIFYDIKDSSKLTYRDILVTYTK